MSWLLVNTKTSEALPAPVSSKTPVAASGSAQPDVKVAVSAEDLTRVKELMHQAKGRVKGSRSKGKTVNVDVVAKYVMNGSPNTVYNTVQALGPVGIPDYTSFAVLYDIARVRGLTIRCSLSANLAPVSPFGWGLAFDPSNIGAYSSISDVMTAQHYFVAASGPSWTTPESVTKDGFRTIHLKFPEQKYGISAVGTSTTSIGGGWFATSTTGVTTGWVKPYIEAMGSSVSALGLFYVTYHMQFSERT